MTRIVKSVFGVVTIAIGVAIVCWCAYFALHPSKDYHLGLIDIPRLALPLIFIWIGWRWLRGDASRATDYSSEITVSIKLSDTGFGTQSERDAILGLKHRLEAKLQHDNLGEIDGEEFGDGECCVFVHTNAPSRAEALLSDFLTRESVSYSLARSDS
jgi:hypothetical protein